MEEKYERLKADVVNERRDLADLRELVFNSQNTTIMDDTSI